MIEETSIARSPRLLAAGALLLGVIILFAAATGGPVALLAITAAIVFPGLVFFPGLIAGLLSAAILVNLFDVAGSYHGIESVGTASILASLAVVFIRGFFMDEDLAPLVPLGIAAVAYIAFLSGPLLWIDYPSATVEQLIESLKGWLIVLTIFGLVTEPRRLRTTGRAITIGLGIVSALAVAQFMSGRFDQNVFGFANASIRQIAGEVHGFRVSGPLPDPNFFAQTLMIGLPVAAVTAWSDPKPLFRLVGFLVTPLLIVTILLTYSRGGVAAMAIVALAFALTTRSRWILIPGAVLGAVVMTFFAPAGLWDRLMEIFQVASALATGQSQFVEDPSLSERMGLLAVALQMFKDNPVWGLGVGQYEVNYPHYALVMGYDPGAPPRAHNRILELMAENGFVGLLVVLALCLAAVSIAWRAARRLFENGRRGEANLVRAFIVGFAGYWVTALFLHNAYPRFFWVQIGLLLSSWWFVQSRTGQRHEEFENA